MEPTFWGDIGRILLLASRANQGLCTTDPWFASSFALMRWHLSSTASCYWILALSDYSSVSDDLCFLLIVDLMHLTATASKLRPGISEAYETNRKNNNNVFTTVVLLSANLRTQRWIQSRFAARSSRTSILRWLVLWPIFVIFESRTCRRQWSGVKIGLGSKSLLVGIQVILR